MARFKALQCRESGS
jgi:hypothetical protein